MTETTEPTARALWLAERKTGIGGSDAAAVVGISPWKTPFQVYQEKRGEVEDEDLSGNEAVEWGLRLEDVVADAYVDRTGRKVRRANALQRHPLFDFVVGNFDRVVVGERRGLECKTVGEFGKKDPNWGPDGSDLVPDTYFMQVQHYMAITGFPVWDVAALFGGRHLRVYEVPRHEATIAKMLIIEREFWTCVLQGIPPEAKTAAEALAKYPSAMRLSIEATDEVAAMVGRYAALKADVKADEEEIDALKAALGEYLGDHDLLSYKGTNLLTWREAKTSSVDSARLKTERPDVYAEYLRTGQTRVMRLASRSTK